MSKKKGKKKSLEAKELIRTISDELQKLAVINNDIVEHYLQNWRKAEQMPPLKFRELSIKARIARDYIGAITYDIERLKEVSKND